MTVELRNGEVTERNTLSLVLDGVDGSMNPTGSGSCICRRWLPLNLQAKIEHEAGRE